MKFDIYVKHNIVAFITAMRVMCSVKSYCVLHRRIKSEWLRYGLSDQNRGGCVSREWQQ